MKTTIFSVFSILHSLVLFCQTNKSEISIISPILYNKTSITNVFGPTRQISGDGVSAGGNIRYKRMIAKGFYANIGFGYFAQNFNIQRPYDDTDFILLLYTTKQYRYHCWEQMIGIGYQTAVSKKYRFDFSANYHRYNTFRQTYIAKNASNITETKYKYHFATVFSIVPSFQRQLSNRVNISTGLIIPLLTSWQKDVRFAENSTERYGPYFHAGVQFGLHYRF